jgi:hypothetical protein
MLMYLKIFELRNQSREKLSLEKNTYYAPEIYVYGGLFGGS